MLTFDNVYQAPLGKLKAAADGWSRMKGRLDTLAEDAHKTMAAKAKADDWRGVNAEVTKPFIDKTAKEFADAAKAADGIHKILDDGYRTFKKAKDDLTKIVESEAPAQGLKVKSDGTVEAAYPVEKDVAARHDPEFPDALRKERAAIAALKRRIDAIVESCDDADVACANALRANITGDKHNFSAPKYASLDAEEAARAVDLARKVTGEGGTARNVEALKQLEELMNDNAKDPEFSTAFYRTMGPEGALEFYATMSLDSTSLGPAGQDRVRMVHGIQEDLGSMLGVATSKNTPGHLDAAWTTALMKAGHKEIDVSNVAGYGTKIYGYQALGALLRDGKYDAEFLTAVGRDMVAMERANPDVWEQGLPYNQEMALNHDKDGGRGFYPLTGLMEALSNNPGGATAFFNEPVREDTNKDGLVTLADRHVSGDYGKPAGMVDYMLDRKPTVDWHDAAVGQDPGSERRALGYALEAAVSGQADPHLTKYADHQPHTEAMANVFERIVEKVGGTPALVDDNLSGSMGRMAAEYIGDINAVYGSDTDDYAKDDKQAHASLKQGSLTPFMDALARHEGSYSTVSAAQQEYTQAAMQLKAEDKGLSEHNLQRSLEHIGQTSGHVNGILAGGRIDAELAGQFEENDEYNKGLEREGSAAGFATGVIFEGMVRRAPVVGELVGWVIDQGISADVDDAKKEPYEGSGEKVKEAYLAGLSTSTLPIQKQVDHLTLPPGVNREVLSDAVLDFTKNGYSNGLQEQEKVGTRHGH
ncbi:hypothetical protein ACFY7C_09170 [Streptomyces sp. NPDC012769]|uniref:hypothetical protein n=1 Tax=Streptomyces sp. NPDC012769 TaxID=3364848 RepID=UPI0036C4A0DF